MRSFMNTTYYKSKWKSFDCHVRKERHSPLPALSSLLVSEMNNDEMDYTTKVPDNAKGNTHIIIIQDAIM